MDDKNYGTSDHPLTKEEAEAATKSPLPWQAGLDSRTNVHIDFARHYARNFAHGAPGHLDLITIAKLADLLDEFQLQTRAS